MKPGALKVAVAIPARFGSTRFPGKPLANILDRPMIQWVWEASCKHSGAENVYVLTDHQKIADAVSNFGGQAIMTAADLPSGTDRIWAGLQDKQWDVVINVQGDEPLVPPALIAELMACFDDPQVQMATAAHTLSEAELDNRNSVKVLLSKEKNAIYFSRFGIPFSRGSYLSPSESPILRHIGIYGYRRKTLQSLCEEPPAWMEAAESLEQLRALYLGIPIRVIESQYQPIGVDSPSDLDLVIDLLTAK